jgi:hypothetical protein
VLLPLRTLEKSGVPAVPPLPCTVLLPLRTLEKSGLSVLMVRGSRRDGRGTMARDLLRQHRVAVKHG